MTASPPVPYQPEAGVDATPSVLVAVADPSRLQGIVGVVERLGYRAASAVSAAEVDAAAATGQVAAMVICNDFGNPGIDVILSCYPSLPTVVIERVQSVSSAPQRENVVVVLHRWFTLTELEEALAVAVASSSQ